MKFETLHVSIAVPSVLTKFGKSAFSDYAPWAWNELQNVINLDKLPTLSIFKEGL